MGPYDTMAHSVVEFFKLDGYWVIPVEFRFLRCRIIHEAGEKETHHWMNASLWRELCQAVISVLKTRDALKDGAAPADPTLLATSHLKLAYILKKNEFDKNSILEQGPSELRSQRKSS